jgi:cytochrome P450
MDKAEGFNIERLRSMEFISNPYIVYKEMRKVSPTFYLQNERYFWILNYKDCASILGDLNYGKKFRRTYEEMTDSNYDDLTHYDPNNPKRNMLFLDPPDHTRLRNLVAKAFTPRNIEKMRPFIRSLAEGLIKNVSDGRDFDLMSGFAGPIPAYTIANILGVPNSDMQKFKNWSDSVALSLDSTRSKEEYEEARVAGENLSLYISNLIDKKKDSLEEDLLSDLIIAEDSGQKLTHRELIATLTLLLVAGHETTTNLIGNGFLALLKNRDQLEMLKSDRSLLKSAVEEFLRYDPPVQQVARAVYKTTVISGTEIREGSRVSAVIGSANRDPEAFENPDNLDITRKENRHLSFSKGIHFCIGSQLARLEAEIAFDILMDNLSDVKIIAEPEWRKNANMHGMKTLLVRKN